MVFLQIIQKSYLNLINIQLRSHMRDRVFNNRVMSPLHNERLYSRGRSADGDGGRERVCEDSERLWARLGP